MPSDESARTSELTFMFPSSVAMAVPERPATTMAVIPSGASSRNTTAIITLPISAESAAGTISLVWITMVAPSSTPIVPMRPIA